MRAKTLGVGFVAVLVLLVGLLGPVFMMAGESPGATSVPIAQVQAAPVAPAAPVVSVVPAEPAPKLPLPFWAYPLTIVGITTGLQFLKAAAPKFPKWLLPLINVGVGMGVSYLTGGTLDPGTIAVNGAAISGTAAVAYDAVSAARKTGDPTR